MSDEKGLLGILLDFSFQRSGARRIIPVLYVIALLAGGVAVVAAVVYYMQQSPANGLLALIFGIVLYVVWVFKARLWLEVLGAIFRMAETIERSVGGHGA